METSTIEKYSVQLLLGNLARVADGERTSRQHFHWPVIPLPDLQEQVDEDCDGVDLNRNYQFEWGAPLGATGPLIPGTCTPAEGELDGSNNDVYTRAS